MTLQIDRGIPLPHNHRKGHTKWLSVIRQMKNGDSILVKTMGEAKSLSFVLRSYGFLSSQRKQAEGGYRIWKIEG